MKASTFRFLNRSIAATALILASAPQAFAAVTYDLTSPSNSVLIQGVYFFQEGSTNATGSGVFNAFQNTQAGGLGGTQIGFNSDASGGNLYLDTKSASKEVFVDGAPVVSGPDDLSESVPANNPIGGINYYAVALDINQNAASGGGFLLSLDRLELWVHSASVADPNTEANLAGAANSRMVWSMDGNHTGGDGIDKEILFNYLTVSSGSGRSDMYFLVPQSLITGPESTYRFTLLSSFGAKGADYVANDGFEEWALVEGLSFNIPPVVPEPSTYAAIGGLAAMFGAHGWSRVRRARRAAPAV